MFKYLQSKKVGRGHCRKSKKEKFLTRDQFLAILDAVEKSQHELNANWKRDYSAIYLAYMLGMRIGEVCVLERNHARDLLAGGDSMYLPTLKQSEKIPFRCKGSMSDGSACNRPVRLRWDMGGKTHTCSKCGTKALIPIPKDKLNVGVVEKDPGFVDEATIKYILEYIKYVMRPDQRWFFEGKFKDTHVSPSYLSRIFGTFAARARGEDGKPCVSQKFSWHSLRHGRGVVMYSETHELEAVREALRHKSLKTTEIYIGLDAELRGQFKKKLNRVAFDPLKKLKLRRKTA